MNTKKFTPEAAQNREQVVDERTNEKWEWVGRSHNPDTPHKNVLVRSVDGHMNHFDDEGKGLGGHQLSIVVPPKVVKGYRNVYESWVGDDNSTIESAKETMNPRKVGLFILEITIADGYPTSRVVWDYIKNEPVNEG